MLNRKRQWLWPQLVYFSFPRKAFRKVVRQADIDDDKEQLMGHVLSGKLKNRIEKLEQPDNGLLTVVQQLQEEIEGLKAEVKTLKG